MRGARVVADMVRETVLPLLRRPRASPSSIQAPRDATPPHQQPPDPITRRRQRGGMTGGGGARTRLLVGTVEMGPFQDTRIVRQRSPEPSADVDAAVFLIRPHRRRW